MKDQTAHAKRLRKEQFDYGFKLAEAFQPIELCTNPDQRDGWRSAVNAAAYAEVSSYLVKSGVIR